MLSAELSITQVDIEIDIELIESNDNYLDCVWQSIENLSGGLYEIGDSFSTESSALEVFIAISSVFKKENSLFYVCVLTDLWPAEEDNGSLRYVWGPIIACRSENASWYLPLLLIRSSRSRMGVSRFPCLDIYEKSPKLRESSFSSKFILGSRPGWVSFLKLLSVLRSVTLLLFFLCGDILSLNSCSFSTFFYGL